MSGYVGRQNPLAFLNLPPQPDEQPQNRQNPLTPPWAYAGNPVGTETTQGVGMPQGPFNQVQWMRPDGTPVMAGDMAAAHGQVQQAMDVAPTIALGMVGDAPGGGGVSPFEFRPASGRALPSDNYLKPLDAHAPHMFREAAPDEAAEILPGNRTVFGPMEKFLADNPDIALGQGANAGGVQLAFDASKLTGQVNRSKPAWGLGYQNGVAEYIGKNSNNEFRDALSGVRVPNTLDLTRGDGRAVSFGLKGLESRGWTKRPGYGFTEYLPPTQQGNGP